MHIKEKCKASHISHLASPSFPALREDQCPVGWEAIGKECYFFDRESRNWEEAKNHCIELAGHLATVTSAEEDMMVREELKEQDITKVLFDANKGKDETTWLTSFGMPLNFSRWGAGQENKNKTPIRRDRCGLLHTEHLDGWRNEPCTDYEMSVCSLHYEGKIIY